MKDAKFHLMRFLLLLLFPTFAWATIIGPESRFILSAHVAPYTVIGVVEAHDGQTCTGTLVAEDLVLTAAHCLERSSGNLTPHQVRFHSSFIYGVSSGILSDVKSIHHGARPERSGDWAILKLKKKLGKELGFLPTGRFSNNDLHKPLVRLVGYDVGFSQNMGLSMSINREFARIKVIRNGVYLHDAPTGVGSSGGPMLMFQNNRWEIVAINVAESQRASCRVFNTQNCFNIAVPESAWRETLNQL
jgi:protease YdgD